MHGIPTRIRTLTTRLEGVCPVQLDDRDLVRPEGIEPSTLKLKV